MNVTVCRSFQDSETLAVLIGDETQKLLRTRFCGPAVWTWRLGPPTEPWPTIDNSYLETADGVMLAVQRRTQRTYFHRQARSFAFCTSAELARIPRIQVQSSHPALAGRSKPRRRHRTIPLARAPYRTIARSPPSPHSPSQQAQPEHQSAADFNISFPARPVARSPALLFTSPVFC
jgi:hypothetical protein